MGSISITISLSPALVEETMTGNKKIMCKVCYREMRSDGIGVMVFRLAENIATQPSLAGAWAELGNKILQF